MCPYEYRFLDPGLTMPLNLPVTAGETFVVALEFANTNAGGGIFTPSVVYDGDGCQPGLGAVLPIPGSWTDICLVGVTGDIVIRAIVDEPLPVPVLPGGLLALLAGLLVLAGISRLRPRLAPASRSG